MKRIEFTNDNQRGVIEQLEEKLFIVTIGAISKSYKTLRGAVNFMTRNGYSEVVAAETVVEDVAENTAPVDTIMAETIAEVDAKLTYKDKTINLAYGLTREQMIELLYNVKIHPELNKLYYYITVLGKPNEDGTISDANIRLSISHTDYIDGEYVRCNSNLDIDVMIKGDNTGGYLVYDYSWDEDNAIKYNYSNVAETIEGLMRI